MKIENTRQPANRAPNGSTTPSDRRARFSSQRGGEVGVKEIEAAKRRLEQNGLIVKGVIFNAVVRKASTYGEYGYYQYEYASTSK